MNETWSMSYNCIYIPVQPHQHGFLSEISPRFVSTLVRGLVLVESERQSGRASVFGARRRRRRRSDRMNGFRAQPATIKMVAL